MFLSLPESKNLINNADVLLFRAQDSIKTVGWWIGKYTSSIYSHAAIASWINEELHAVEFREFIGGRIHPMNQYIEEKNHSTIDVFRPVDTIMYPYIETIDGKVQIAHKEKVFNADIALKITNTAEDLVTKIGDYSWWTIWQMCKAYIPFVRLGRKVRKNGEEPDPKEFVCSTLITYVYRKHFIDPIPFLPDNMTSPGDLARSALFSYIFSIKS